MKGNERQGSPAEPNGLEGRWREIASEAEKVLGGKDEAVRWLGLPKVALGGKTPVSVMRTAEGCEAVEKLLREVWD